MERRNINPGTWQDQAQFSQAVEFSGHKRVLVCAGQTAVTHDGQPQHEGDMRAQLAMAFDNLEEILQGAGMTLANVVRLNYFTTDIDTMFGAWDVAVARLQGAGIQPAGTALQIARLAFPSLLVEIEATAVD
jgi:enamine deaminase RidA (YjgF/YER057c/UK114 family)